MEGEISQQSILNSLHRGLRASGDLIPWTISQQFQDHQFPQMSGARIVRIATHQDFQGVRVMYTSFLTLATTGEILPLILCHQSETYTKNS